MARSRAGFFRIDSAFPASAPGRHHMGPFGACSSFTRVTACQVARPPFCGLCREVPTRPVSQPSRSPAIESNHQLFEWVLPPLVICPFRAHAEACPTRQLARIFHTVVLSAAQQSTAWPCHPIAATASATSVRRGDNVICRNAPFGSEVPLLKKTSGIRLPTCPTLHV